MKIGTLVRISEANQAKGAFNALREMEIPSCQLVYKPAQFIREDAYAIKEAAQDSGVEISAFFCGNIDGMEVYDLEYGFVMNGLTSPAFRARRLEYLMSGAEFTRWMGVTDMIIHAGFIPPNLFDAEYSGLVASVCKLALKCKEYGVYVLFETGAESPISLLRLIEDVKQENLGVNLDTGNSLMYGYSNPVDALYTFGKYVRNLHAKDGAPPTVERKLGAETAIGEGEVDFPAVIKRLKEIGYDRYITIEREISGEQQKKDILKAKKYLEKLWSKTGKNDGF